MQPGLMVDSASVTVHVAAAPHRARHARIGGGTRPSADV